MLLAVLALAAAISPVCDAVWHDAARNRDVPVRIHMPEPLDGGRGGNPIILYSPGLGGGSRSGAAWARAWVEKGFAVIAMGHPGSDAAVYAGVTDPEQRRARVTAATAPVQQAARIADAVFVIDTLARREAEGACDLAQLATDRIAVAGHSMGAWTAQALAGQRFAGRAMVADKRIRAAVLMSSTGPTGAAADAAFGKIDIPVMVITGTSDGVAPGARPEVAAAALAQRTAPYDGMPADDRKYLLVVAGAEHMMFDGKTLPSSAPPLARHTQDVVAELTTRFFSAWFFPNEDSISSIDSAQPPQLEAGDRYTRK